MQDLNLKMLLLKLKTCSLPDAFSLWCAFQLLWAGRLSVQDIKACLGGIISPPGLVSILSTVLLTKFFRWPR